MVRRIIPPVNMCIEATITSVVLFGLNSEDPDSSIIGFRGLLQGLLGTN